MATLNLQAGASSDDAYATNNATAATLTGHIEFVGEGSTVATVALRFTGVTIPQGTVITSAILTLKAASSYSTGNSIKGKAACQDADNPGTFTTANGNLNTTNRPRTAYSTTWSLPTVTAETDYTKDITAQVQAILNRGGWVSGNAIVVLIDDDGSTLSEWQDMYSYDDATSKAAKLDITYPAGGLPFANASAEIKNAVYRM
jgi:hypothetical protein